MNVFASCSGRCVPKTFALVSKPISNFTSGLETRANFIDYINFYAESF